MDVDGADAEGESESTRTRSSRQSLDGYHGWELLRQALADREGSIFSAPAMIKQPSDEAQQHFRVMFEPDARFAAEEGAIYQNPKMLAYRMMITLSDTVVYQNRRRTLAAANTSPLPEPAPCATQESTTAVDSETVALDLSTLDAARARVSAPAPAPDTAGSVFDQTVLTFSRIFGAPAEAAAASSVVPAPGTDE